MPDVYAVVEGRGELGFLRECVAPHLGARGVHLHPVLVGKPGHKGGARPWPAVRKEIANFLRMGKKERPVHVTMMFDYFRMPTDWPGRASAPAKAPGARAAHIEQHLAADMQRHLGGDFDPALFLPYVQMHELEALILAEPQSLAAEFLGQDSAVQALANSIQGLAPEDVNDDPATAPSKRIIACLPEYAGRKAQAVVNVLDLDRASPAEAALPPLRRVADPPRGARWTRGIRCLTSMDRERRPGPFGLLRDRRTGSPLEAWPRFQGAAPSRVSGSASGVRSRRPVSSVAAAAKSAANPGRPRALLISWRAGLRFIFEMSGTPAALKVDPCFSQNGGSISSHLRRRKDCSKARRA